MTPNHAPWRRVLSRILAVPLLSLSSGLLPPGPAMADGCGALEELLALDQVDTVRPAFDLALQGSRLYLANEAAGVQIIDISQPSDLQVLGTASSQDYVFDVLLRGDVLFAAADLAGLEIYDVSSPAAPTRLGSALGASGLLRVAEADGFIVASGPRALSIFDVTDLTSPKLIGAWAPELPESPFGVEVRGHHAFVVGSPTLSVFDISVPQAPVPVARLFTSDSSNDLLIQDDLAYITNGASGLVIVDVSQPTAPAIVGTLDLPGATVGVSIVGPYAFLATIVAGIQVVDIADPAAPQLVGAIDPALFNQTFKVLATSDLVFVASSFGGLVVLPQPCDLTPVVVGAASRGLHLSAPAPNPFNPRTALQFELPRPMVVDLGVYDVAGRHVRALLQGAQLPAGSHRVTWDGRDDRGQRVASGSYLCSMVAEGFERHQRLTLVK